MGLRKLLKTGFETFGFLCNLLCINIPKVQPAIKNLYLRLGVN